VAVRLPFQSVPFEILNQIKWLAADRRDLAGCFGTHQKRAIAFAFSPESSFRWFFECLQAVLPLFEVWHSACFENRHVR
jgi:hypothetical protein